MSAGNAAARAAFQYRSPTEEKLTVQSKLSKIKTRGPRGAIIKIKTGEGNRRGQISESTLSIYVCIHTHTHTQYMIKILKIQESQNSHKVEE